MKIPSLETYFDSKLHVNFIAGWDGELYRTMDGNLELSLKSTIRPMYHNILILVSSIESVKLIIRDELSKP